MKADEKMNETKSDPGANPEPRRPFWVVGLPLLGLVVAILVGAFLLDRQFRPAVGIEPAPTTGAATPALAFGGTRPPTEQPIAPAGQVPAAAATPIETMAVVRIASSPLEREIEAAFQKYLQIYSQAVWELDASHLHEVLAGQALRWVTDEVNQLKAEGRPVKIVEEERKVALARVTETSATVVDDYVSRSVYVDPQTKQPLPRTKPPTRVRQSYELRKIDGIWKIVDGTREVLSEGSR